MACYNRKGYIEKALDSIIPQLTSDDEIIISDDHSTDGTIEVIKEYQKRYPQIKPFFQEENLGIDKNMGFLFDEAEKDILVICDSDDISMPNRIEEIKKALENSPSKSVVYHNGTIINQYDNETNDDFFKAFNQKENMLHQLIYTTYYGAFLAFKKDFWESAKDKFVSNNNLSWDRKIGLLAKKRKQIIFLDKKLLKYRRWENNASVKKKTGIFKKIKCRLDWLKFYLRG